MKKLFLMGAALSSLLMATGVCAEFKVGVVDTGMVLQKSSLMTAANTELNKKFKPRQDELAGAQRRLQDETDQLSNGTLSQDDRTKLQNKVINDKATVDIMSASFQRDLTIAKNDALQKVMEKLSEAINKIAQSGHYNLIEQRANILFIDKNIDITQDVIREMS